ncbi:transcriptional regulator [uncultured Campylobacter sp.]|uniref:transcriptional regulator n=1 Tax=uncultured Campylobacter sp. TaxID=218934 RepID=UPI00262FCEBD|nr:transcriptional regulator [uncultured Campylobacter sp.]
MTKRDIAGYLGVDVQTLRNWKKTRPNLYRVIMQGLAIDDTIEHMRKSYEKLLEFSNETKDKNTKAL